MKSFLALNLQVAEASVAAMYDMPIVAAAKAIASRQAIIFSFDVCIGLAGPPLSCRVWTSADAGNHSTKLRRRWFAAPTVVLRERSRSLMTVRRLTARCLSPLRNKRNSTGGCHAAEFQTGRCRRWVMSRHFGKAAQRLLSSRADIRQYDRQVRIGTLMSQLGQQRRSKAARTLVRSTPKGGHADRQRILRLGAITGSQSVIRSPRQRGRSSSRKCETECFRRLEIDSEFELRRLFNRQVCRFGAP